MGDALPPDPVCGRLWVPAFAGTTNIISLTRCVHALALFAGVTVVRRYPDSSRDLEMQKQGLILLAAAALALVVLAAVAIASADHNVSRAAPGKRAQPALAGELGDVTTVGIKRNALSLTF